jgi:saccharopine dehydrogenase-like NADP-dependent oxidoreductase
MGSRAVEDLASSQGVQRVTIADRNMSAAREIATRLHDATADVDVKPVDADDHRGLVQTMRGYDVAASALGPFHRFEARMVRAAIEAKVDYASICDEWEPAGSIIDQFHLQARRENVVIITGLGASPGMSNAAISYCAQQLDSVQRADVSVYQPLNAGGGEAVVRHMLHIISGPVVAWRGGARATIPACSEQRTIEFPRFGTIDVWNMGHSEPETVPRFMSGIQEVSFFMGFGRGSGILVRPAQLGLLASRRIRNGMARLISFVERVSGSDEPDWGAIRVDVWGELAGEQVHLLVCGIGQMREVTGLSLSCGTQMLARRQLLVDTGGVYAPEACLDPRALLAYLNSRGVNAYSDVAMTQPLT